MMEIEVLLNDSRKIISNFALYRTVFELDCLGARYRCVIFLTENHGTLPVTLVFFESDIFSVARQTICDSPIT